MIKRLPGGIELGLGGGEPMPNGLMAADRDAKLFTLLGVIPSVRERAFGIT